MISGIGGAALVPVAAAAATIVAHPQRRGQALAIVGSGFTLATAVGAPLGTALGDATGWQTTMWVMVVVAAVLAIAMPLTLGRLPTFPAVSFKQRLLPLSDPSNLKILATVTFMLAGLNMVYLLASTVTDTATGGFGSLLAALLLAYG